MKRIFVSGCYDIIHAGMCSFLPKPARSVSTSRSVLRPVKCCGFTSNAAALFEFPVAHFPFAPSLGNIAAAASAAMRSTYVRRGMIATSFACSRVSGLLSLL